MSTTIAIPPGTPQRVVSISITTNKKVTKAHYSYVSPTTGLSYQDAPVCDLKVDKATACLFVLDYLTSENGWIIDSIAADPGSEPIPYELGANQLSVLTYDPYLAVGDVYNFTIKYSNKLVDIPPHIEDPQEGNGPPAPTTK